MQEEWLNKDSEQGDRMSLGKNRPKSRPTHVVPINIKLKLGNKAAQKFGLFMQF
jgi:hypothetical protein